MDASQYKNYILTLLFMKYVTDKSENDPNSLIVVPEGGSFADISELKGKVNIGEGINTAIRKLAEANRLEDVLDQADFDDNGMLGTGREMQDRLSRLVAIFEGLDFSSNRAGGDDLLGDAYEYLMMHFATESGKSKGQFYTPAEVSRIIAKAVVSGNVINPTYSIYDPTCGSGSLIMRAADEAPYDISIYGQDMDNANYALARMNMVLHDRPYADIRRGNTLSSPLFGDGRGGLKQFDFAVANPPFSTKEWTSGVNLENDPYGRFEYGTPPPRNGDYAFLLHLLTSLNSRGKGAIIMPHGVLFRGNKEADIRRNLVRRGFIKGIIGLPANLFYGTGIPACIVVLDKENARTRDAIFMIDASKGFIKDGNKNRLREQDIHKIVNAFNGSEEIQGFSRLVPLDEIADATNDYNLNIPRYIDSGEPEDLHDLDAHLNGGIPDRDIDALSDYWEVFPSLHGELFAHNGRPGYSEACVQPADVRSTILENADFEKYFAESGAVFEEWRDASRPILLAINEYTNPKEIVDTLSEDLLRRYGRMPLIDPYGIYQIFMDYWNDVLQDDVYLVTSEGWGIGRSLRRPEEKEEADFTIKDGRRSLKYVSDLIPPSLIIDHFFAEERRELDEMEAEEARLRQEKEEFEETHTVDGGALDGLEGSRGITKGNVQLRVMELRKLAMDTLPANSPEFKQAKAITKTKFGIGEWNEGVEDEDGLFAELDILHGWLQTEAAASECRKSCATKLNDLYKNVGSKYTALSDDEIKPLVVEYKWYADVRTGVEGEIERVTQRLTERVRTLEERYADSLPELQQSVYEFGARVERHMREMGVAYD